MSRNQTNEERIRKEYETFKRLEAKKQAFTLDELATEVGLKKKSASTYVSKKWQPFIKKVDKAKYLVDGIGAYSFEEFRRLSSQTDRLSNDPRKPELKPETESLLIKAKDSALIALDVYNRPATAFRTEGFIVFMSIAWTALFHAIFEKREIEYIHRDKNGKAILVDGEEKSWELGECAAMFFGSSENNAIRTNLDFMYLLRNKIEHRFVPAIDLHVVGECQAMLLNFNELLHEEFGDYYAITDSLAVPLQTSRLQTSSRTDALRKLQANHYEELRDFIDAYRDALPDSVYKDPRYSFRVFLVPKIGNHRDSSDLAFEFVKYDATNAEELSALQKQVALIREKQVPVANQGCFRPSQVVAQVRERTGRDFNIYLHTASWKMYGVRQPGQAPEACNTTYCQFDSAHEDYIYTQAWINHLVGKLSSEDEYKRLLDYKASLNKRRVGVVTGAPQ